MDASTDGHHADCYIPRTYRSGDNKIIASLQKLLSGNQYQHTNKKSKRGHNSAKMLRMITNIKLDLYFKMIYPSANFQ